MNSSTHTTTDPKASPKSGHNATTNASTEADADTITVSFTIPASTSLSTLLAAASRLAPGRYEGPPISFTITPSPCAALECSQSQTHDKANLEGECQRLKDGLRNANAEVSILRELLVQAQVLAWQSPYSPPASPPEWGVGSPQRPSTPDAPPPEAQGTWRSKKGRKRCEEK